MDFLTNLYDKVKSGVSKAASWLTSPLSGVGSAGAPSASVLDAFTPGTSMSFPTTTETVRDARLTNEQNIASQAYSTSGLAGPVLPQGYRLNQLPPVPAPDGNFYDSEGKGGPGYPPPPPSGGFFNGANIQKSGTYTAPVSQTQAFQSFGSASNAIPDFVRNLDVRNRFLDTGSLTNQLGGAQANLATQALTPEEKEEERKRQEAQFVAQNRLTVPTIPSEFNLEDLNRFSSETAQFLSSKEAISPNDRAAVQASLENYVNQYVQKNRTPNNVVVPTPEQAKWEQQNPDRIQQADKLRQDLGITAKEQEKITLMKQLQGLNEAMGKIVDDINSNPNLPKGLAQRRIAEFQAQNKDTINQLLGSIEIVNAELGQLNDQLNFRLGIMKDEEAARERAIDNQRQNLNILIDSGAFGSMTDAELQNWAQNTGFTVESLTSMRKAIAQRDQLAIDKAKKALVDEAEKTQVSPFLDIMQDEINNGATAQAAARTAASVSESLGVPVSSTTLSSWVEQAGRLKPVQTTTQQQEQIPEQNILVDQNGKQITQGLGIRAGNVIGENIYNIGSSIGDISGTFWSSLFGE